jgi:glycosyltransferase involved in cell wall biosynthesis
MLQPELLAVTAADPERSLQENERTFAAILDLARDHLRSDDAAAGFVTCELAAHFAWHNHPGFFASRELEELVLGMTDRVAEAPRREALTRGKVEAVLHVMTEAYLVGGHSRLVERWIDQDRSRRHSVLLTTSNGTIPGWLVAAVRSASGTLIQLRSESDLVARASELRRFASAHDVVLLHTHPFDCLPLLAFGGRTDRPRVAFVDHADHAFWVGRPAADVVVHLGDAGRELGRRRRNLSPDSTTTLPIPIGSVTRTMSRRDAKEALGLERTNLVLCTAATDHKYAELGEVHFLDLVMDVVVGHPEVVLLAPGVESNDRWDAAAQASGGRIRPLGPLEDVGLQLDAADIYLDSYPVASNTSLLEAAARATPVVAFDPGPPSLAVLRAGDPGLGGSLSRARDLVSFKALLEELVVHEALRHQAGAELSDEVARAHTGHGWQSACERVYSMLIASPTSAPHAEPATGERNELDEALCRLSEIRPHSLESLVALRAHLSGLPVPLPRPRTAPGLTRRIAEGNASGLAGRVAELEQGLTVIEAGVAAMRDYIDALQGTVSWRITAPLRRLRPRRRRP